MFTCQKHNLKPILTDYIYRIIPSKDQKGKPQKMDLPLLKNDITNKLGPQKPAINSETVEKVQKW